MRVVDHIYSLLWEYYLTEDAMGFFKNVMDNARALKDLKKVDSIINDEINSITLMIKNFKVDVPDGNPLEALAYMSKKYYECTDADIRNSGQYQDLLFKMISNSITRQTGLVIPVNYISEKLMQNQTTRVLVSML